MQGVGFLFRLCGYASRIFSLALSQLFTDQLRTTRSGRTVQLARCGVESLR